VQLQARARGSFRRPLIGSEPPPEFVEQTELEYPLEELEPLAFVLNRLLGEICSRLSAYSAAAQQIDLHLDLQPEVVVPAGVAPGFSPAPAGISPAHADLKAGATTAHEKGDGAVPWQYEKRIPLPVPTRDAKLLLNLLRIQLETDPPSAPVGKVVLKATPAPPRVAQGGLFVPLAPDPEKLEITLARIAGLVGRQNVGSPRLVDSYRPGMFEMQPFAVMPDVAPADRERSSAGTECGSSLPLCPSPTCWRHTARKRASGSPSGSKLPHSTLFNPASFKSGPADAERVALRIYRPPAPASVSLKNDIPNQLSFRGIRGQVVTAGGPWRTSGCWWQPEAWQYDEWDLEMEIAGSGLAGFYLICFDRAARRWFVRGEYY
jgi:protein ImuB